MADMYKIIPSTVIPEEMVSTLMTPPFGYEGVQSFGVVKGISVRTRNVCADFLIALNALIGGTNYLVRELYYDTRQEAYNFMLEEAFKKGANAVIGLKYESTEGGVLCYGTSVRVRKL